MMRMYCFACSLTPEIGQFSQRNVMLLETFSLRLFVFLFLSYFTNNLYKIIIVAAQEVVFWLYVYYANRTNQIQQ